MDAAGAVAGTARAGPGAASSASASETDGRSLGERITELESGRGALRGAAYDATMRHRAAAGASREPPAMIRLVWLFDGDGTLLRTFGSREAFRAATRLLTGEDDTLEGVSFAGRTDPLILAEIMKRHGRTLTAADTERFWQVAREVMGRVLSEGKGLVLPGVQPLLEAIRQEPTWIPALLTGNTAAMARLKLEAFDLADSFVFGAFGDEAPDREAL